VAPSAATSHASWRAHGSHPLSRSVAPAKNAPHAPTVGRCVHPTPLTTQLACAPQGTLLPPPRHDPGSRRRADASRLTDVRPSPCASTLQCIQSVRHRRAPSPCPLTPYNVIRLDLSGRHRSTIIVSVRRETTLKSHAPIRRGRLLAYRISINYGSVLCDRAAVSRNALPGPSTPAAWPRSTTPSRAYQQRNERASQREISRLFTLLAPRDPCRSPYETLRA